MKLAENSAMNRDHADGKKERDDKHTTDALTATFFDAFTNDAGAAARIDCMYDVFIPEGVIIKNTGSAPESLISRASSSRRLRALRGLCRLESA